MGTHIIGPLLENAIESLNTENIKENLNDLDTEIIFQKDGAPSHYDRDVCKYLYNNFRDRYSSFTKRSALLPDLSYWTFSLGLRKTKDV